MGKITESEMEEIRKMVKLEFPNDPALQQVHIARKIIAREAELERSGFAAGSYCKENHCQRGRARRIEFS
jgi:hypothetical protein